MIGPPFLKLSIKKLELKMPCFGAGVGEAVGLAATGLVAAGDSNVTGTEAPGLGAKPRAPGAVAAGFAGAGGLAVVGRVDAGLPVAGAGGVISGGAGGVGPGGAGDCAKEVSASAVEQRQAVSSVFIIDLFYRLGFR